jgi:hypothetical protein
MATAVGSLPHRDAREAASAVLRCLPELPVAPQLPRRDPRENMLAQWLVGVPGVAIGRDGSYRVGDDLDPRLSVDAHLDGDAHGGFVAFVEAVQSLSRPPKAVKAQVTGPLTIGTALTRAGVDPLRAFASGARIARDWAVAVERYFESALPDSELVLFFDEPALVEWQGADGPLEREFATDLLSAALAACTCISGVHVCGAGTLSVALAAGPEIVHVDVAAVSVEDSLAITRFLEGDGWIAWGAVPTHGPIGEHPSPLWKALLDIWCELTKRGCDPVRLRRQALVAPACGLAGHGASQAERAMLLARELGDRIHDQAAATRLAMGA